MTWRLLRHSTLFSKWCSKKYISLWSNVTQKASSLWKVLKSIAMVFKRCFSFILGPQSTLLLFFDPWYRGNSLIDIVEEHYIKCLELPINSTLQKIELNDA